MIILRDSSPILAQHKGAVIALGNFDGLHRGHQAVIAQAIARAKQHGIAVGILTFEPHPSRIFRPTTPIFRILPFREKCIYLQNIGVDFIRVIRFTRGFSHTTAEQFITTILVKNLQVSHVVTGEDFIFGHNREGNAPYLKEKGMEYGFGATACAQIIVGGERCSSTRIRGLLAEGKVREAADLLGRRYSIGGRVSVGDKRGRTLGFPTANIVPHLLFTPANGVYAVKAKVRDMWVQGVANLGTRPTFDGKRKQLEVHLFEWEEAIYGDRIEVAFVERLRGERHFENIEALKTQIAHDIVKAKIFLTDA